MSSRSVAVVYALLMFTSALPVSQASHTDALTPEVPTLPHAKPTDECLPSDLDEDLLVRAQQLAANDPAWYRTEQGVPGLCVQGGPAPEMASLVAQADAILENLRNASREVQRQVDLRLEHTLPESDYPNDLVQPRTVLLDERFDGRRYTGFGDWKVVTEKAEPEAWRLQTSHSVNGTRTVYRFGNDLGYERGIHQWLVSPEIDLTALKGDENAVRDLEYLRDRARNLLYRACNEMDLNNLGPAVLQPTCGEGSSIRVGNVAKVPGLSALVTAYELAIDSTVYTLPVMGHGAYMDLTYRFNLAPQLDGVRLWIYAGEEAPDRRLLYNEFFGRGDAYRECAYQTDPRLPDERPNATLNSFEETTTLLCQHGLEGGQTVPTAQSGEASEPLPGMARTSAFRQGKILPQNNVAFTGNMSEFTTARLNLTDFMGQRIWVLFEVKTLRNDRGVDIFSDPGTFGRPRDFGFELARVYVEGDGYHRNVRLKELGANLARVSPTNDEGDTRDVRVALPPGDHVLVYVHNAGDYRENVSLTLRANRTFTTRVDLLPDEVRAVKVPWGNLTLGGAPLRNGTVYHVNASIAFITNETPTAYDISQQPGVVLDPNATAVRPANAASLPELKAGATRLYQPIRADTVRNLTFQRTDGGTGNPVQLCRAVEEGRCAEHYAGRKGEPRTILVGLRNDGNAPQDASVDLKLELDGVERPDMVLGGPTRAATDLLPGETRALEWSIIPTLPGAYRVVLVPHREGEAAVRDPTAERRMFVQRSTGVICMDTLEERECGPTFEGGFVPLLREEDVTASALGPDGTLYVATRIREERADGVHTGKLAARDPATGAWRELANLSATLLNATFPGGPNAGTNVANVQMAWGSIRAIVPAASGDLWLFGDNATALKWNASGLSRALDGALLARPQFNLTTALVHNGTLLVAGDHGILAAVNGTKLDHVPLWNTSVDHSADPDVVGVQRYDGRILDVAVGPNGRLVVVGDDGVLLRHNSSGSIFANTTWQESRLDGRLLAWALGNRTLTSVASHEGRLYVGGAGSILLVSTDETMTDFVPVASPVVTTHARHTTFITPDEYPGYPPDLLRTFAQLYVADGRLHALDDEGNLASCARCATTRIEWAYETLPLPAYAPLRGATHLPFVDEVATLGARVVLVGEAGLVMDRVERGDYDNDRSWTTVPALAARDGGVFQTRRFAGLDHADGPQSYIGVPTAEGRAVANAAERYRLFVNHSVAQANETYRAKIKLMYLPVYDTQLTTTRLCGIPSTSQAPTVGTGLVCYGDVVRYEVANFTRATQTDGWEALAYDALPTGTEVLSMLGSADPIGLSLYAIEFQQDGTGTFGVIWAVDDVRLQGLVDGAWRDILVWRGPHDDDKRWWHSDLLGAAHLYVGDVTASAIGQTPKWEVSATAFDLQPASMWHLATHYADRPVFAANSEFYELGDSSSFPRLVNNGSHRLVSPVVDLSDAYDPQLVFRHNYSFRTRIYSLTNGSLGIAPGDGGTVEVQYLRRGADCGSSDPTVTCGWSRFYTLVPDGGYPTKDAMGFANLVYSPESNGRATIKGRIAPEKAFWGRLATPDETGEITSPRDTDSYQEVRVTLGRTPCGELNATKIEKGIDDDCVYAFDEDGQAIGVNLTGRQVRFAFHLYSVTFQKGDYSVSEAWDAVGNGTFPGEGWYVTDVQVRGASKLGIDLRATNLTLRVGYDADVIGVGPGTRVPVNVTIDNLGAFDVLGYTGRLEVRRVVDASQGVTAPVETIVLPQQPVLDAGGRANHTLWWTVPATEGAEYVLSFEALPMGIARDENVLDNTAMLGSLVDPLAARSVRRFSAEFLVSPENATADITRYIPMFVNNTGNVPLSGIVLERRITQQGVTVDREARTCAEWRQFLAESRRTAIVDCRLWNTTRAAPEGTRSPLNLLSEELNPSADLFWKAPARASFLVSVSAQTQAGGQTLVSGADKRVAAFATYLFDDVESGTRGDAITGSWVYGEGWNVTQPGFRSTDAYAFGDATVGRYAPDANASLVAPTVDLGSARTARVAFYHDYAFEPSFDGGLIEASADGGLTWTAVPPIADPLTSVSYNRSLPIQASSALHPTGDPGLPAFAFTGDSELLPGHTGGYVLTQLDLTDYANVTESAVAYEAFTSAELGGLTRIDGGAPDPRDRRLYRAADWCEDADAEVCWGVENLTVAIESPLSRNDPENTFWWSGSPRISDDGMRPLQNYMMEFKVPVAGITEDERVYAEWWEYASRFAGRGHSVAVGRAPVLPSRDHVLSAYTFLQGTTALGATWRFNLSQPRILETDGHWYRMRSDITDIVRAANARGPEMTVAFAYTPVKEYADDLYRNEDVRYLANLTSTNATDYFGLDRAANTLYPTSGFFETDPGFAIDGISIKAIREARGAILSEQVLLDETAEPTIWECGIGQDAPTTGTPPSPDTSTNKWAVGGTTAAGCMDKNAAFVRHGVLDRFKETGRSWAKVGEMPGIPSSWQIVKVRDQSDRAVLPTGEEAVAWWTGDIACRGTEARCPQPGSEARLVTPAVDLGSIAGDNAALSFWHRFAFFSYAPPSGGIPLSSGGVVEIQEFDPQTGSWKPWRQLYSKATLEPGPDSMLSQLTRDDRRGGYTGVTANVSRSSSGVLRYDAPFEAHDLPGRAYDYQYLYTGSSYRLEGNLSMPDGAVDGWLRETYDLREFLGKRVRFGFHYSYSQWPTTYQASEQGSMPDPDGNRIDEPQQGDLDAAQSRRFNLLNARSGWWVGDISVVGDVLVGKPVQLRMRAASDGNVHEGGWKIDDFGVFGSRYKENVGIFVDTTPLKYGATENGEATIPVTVRNLGESVRRDLAIEVVRTDKTPLEITADAPGGTEIVDGKLVLKGFTLSPGQSATVDLLVKTRSFGASNTTLLLRLREQNPVAGAQERFVAITDNEVRGLLQREILFGLQRTPLVEPVSSLIRQVAPELGEPVEMELVLRNPGYGPATLRVNCTAVTVLEHVDVVHPNAQAPDTPVVAAQYPCAREGSLVIAPQATQTYVFRATPTTPGFMSFKVGVSVVNGTNLTRTAGVSVGASPFAWRVGFDRLVDVTSNFTDGATPGAQWSHLRGHDAPGALLIGIDENDSSISPGYSASPEFGGCGIGTCRARSESIDLHNYSVGSPAFLSFWHMDRFAKFDGAQVRARVLLNEQKPDSTPESLPSAWTDPCILRPLGDYEGAIRQKRPTTSSDGQGGTTQVGGDANGVFVDGTRYPSTLDETPRDFFVSDGGRWEETWELASFDLSQTCVSVRPGRPNPTLVGKTVRFEFEVYTGDANGELRRGLGHGWLIDDVVVSPYALSVRPATSQRAAMMDNTTKTFNVIAKNLASTPDIVRLEFDAGNSSAPEGSVVVPSDSYVLQPGESRALPVRVTLPRDPSLLPTEFKARVLARSAIDRNAVGATLIELAFGPRQWAELSLTVQPPGGIVQEGTDAYIPVTIENVGLVDSVATRVLVVDEWAGGRTETSLDLAPVPSYQQDADGATRVLEFRWRPEKGTVGPHTLTFVVDPDVLGEEYTRSNNLATLTLDVSDLLIPDLAIDGFGALSLRNAVGGAVSPALDADVARYEVTAGEVVTFEVKVANRGRAGATNVDVRAFIGPLSLPPKQVPYVAPGSEVAVTFAWLAQKGEHELEFLARSEQVEITVDNNRYPGVGRSILTVKGYEVDVLVAPIEGLLEPGTEASFAFSITNSGNAGEELVLRASSPAGTRVLLPREGFYLRPGETYTATARLLLDDDAVAGEQFISVDALARENPMKVASGRAAMRVNASYAGSIAGGLGLGAPTEIELPIELVNEGNSLEPWTLRVQLPAGWSARETLPLRVSVPPHDLTTVTLHLQVPATTAPGDRVLRLHATLPNGDVREGQARVQVTPIRAAALTVSAELPQAERGTLRIPIEVENKGNVKQPFSVILTSAPVGVELRVTPDTFDLEPGAKAVAALVVKPDANVSAGTYAVTGYTRFEGVVANTREGLANVQTLRLPIVRQDVAVGAIESTPRAGLEPGDRVSVKVPVHNRGVAALTDVPVHLFVDDVFVGETVVPRIEPGARAEAAFNWTAMQGVHTLTVVVDPYEDTVDADRADNAVSLLATVGQDAGGAGSVAAGRADTPALGLAGILAALALGIALTRRDGSRRQRR